MLKGKELERAKYYYSQVVKEPDHICMILCFITPVVLIMKLAGTQYVINNYKLKGPNTNLGILVTNHE